MKTLIKNGRVLAMSGGVYENGSVLFDEKIIYAGAARELDADEIIDARGAVIMPGLIDAHCHVGMFGDSLGFEGADGNEATDPVTPQLRAIDAINPFDRAFEDARRAGVTTVVTGPGSSNAVGGQFAAVKTYGICVDDMIVRAPAAMKMALGENPKRSYSEKDEAPVTRMGTMALIRELLIKARNYAEDKREYLANRENASRPEYDMKLEAMIPVLERKIPVKIHAHRADDICSAIRLGREFDIDVTIEHCSDGDAVADALVRAGVPVMLGPTLSDRSKPELSNLSFDTYKNLSDRGLDVAIITDHPEITIENLPLAAAMAVKHGMDRQKALEGITITAAKNCRIQDAVGSLDAGKDADVAVFTSEPVDFDSHCLMTFINGKRVF